MSGGSAGVFRWLKMIFLPDEGADTIYFFRTSLRAVGNTLADLFRPTSADCTTKGGVSSSTVCSVPVIEVHKPKLLSFGLYFTPATYEARIFDVLFKTLYGIVRYRTNTYMLCVFGQCGVLGFPFGTTTSTPTIVG